MADIKIDWERIGDHDRRVTSTGATVVFDHLNGSRGTATGDWGALFGISGADPAPIVLAQNFIGDTWTIGSSELSAFRTDISVIPPSDLDNVVLPSSGGNLVADGTGVFMANASATESVEVSSAGGTISGEAQIVLAPLETAYFRFEGSLNWIRMEFAAPALPGGGSVDVVYPDISMDQPTQDHIEFTILMQDALGVTNAREQSMMIILAPASLTGTQTEAWPNLDDRITKAVTVGTIETADMNGILRARTDATGTLVFTLDGNPAGASRGFEIYVLATVRDAAEKMVPAIRVDGFFLQIVA